MVWAAQDYLDANENLAVGHSGSLWFRDSSRWLFDRSVSVGVVSYRVQMAPHLALQMLEGCRVI